MRRRAATGWLRLPCIGLAACLAAGGAAAQAAAPLPPSSTARACTDDVAEPPLEALFGRWEARIDGEPRPAVVRLSRHPDYAGVQGDIVRGTATAQLAGDIGDDGMLNIDESADGRSIRAVWTGQWRASTCGRVVEGTWRDAADDSTHPFVLTKTGSLP